MLTQRKVTLVGAVAVALSRDVVRLGSARHRKSPALAGRHAQVPCSGEAHRVGFRGERPRPRPNLPAGVGVEGLDFVLGRRNQGTCPGPTQSRPAQVFSFTLGQDFEVTDALGREALGQGRADAGQQREGARFQIELRRKWD